jgi:hypothetical protein
MASTLIDRPQPVARALIHDFGQSAERKRQKRRTRPVGTPSHCREEPTWYGKGRPDVLIDLVRCLCERLELVAREHPFTTIADFGSKEALYRRFWPKDAPLAV